MKYPSKLFKALPLVLAMAGAFSMHASPVLAAEAASTQARAFDINPGSLTTVLNQFAATAGVTLSFSTAQTNGLNSPGLKGRYSVRHGFDAVLAGSGLEVIETGEGVFAL
ncbi:MAG: STN domain-containing protein [Methylobacillus glycogenes]|nr:STN domain-containing protein [Methylobacillus glycogenes]